MTFADAKQFIAAWYEAANQEDVCRRLQMDRRDVSNRAAYLRRSGLALKALPGRKTGQPGKPGMTPEQWAELARLVSVCNSAIDGQRYRNGQ